MNARNRIKQLGFGTNEDFLTRGCALSLLTANKNVIKQNMYTLNIIISNQNTCIFWNPYTGDKYVNVYNGLCAALYT